jgi:DUF3040 family protein
MLSREDSRRLAELERQLRHDDPEFCARMSAGLPDRRPRHRAPFSLIFTAAVIWLAAVALGVLGWWVAAALTALCATAVVAAVVCRPPKRTATPANTDKSDGTLRGDNPWGATPGADNSRGSTPRAENSWGGTPGVDSSWGSSTPGAGSPWGSGSTPGTGSPWGSSTPGAGSPWGSGGTPGVGNERDGGSTPGTGGPRDGGDTKESGTPTE